MQDKMFTNKEPEDVLVIDDNTIYEIDMHCVRCKTLNSEGKNHKKQKSYCEDYNKKK